MLRHDARDTCTVELQAVRRHTTVPWARRTDATDRVERMLTAFRGRERPASRPSRPAPEPHLARLRTSHARAPTPPVHAARAPRTPLAAAHARGRHPPAHVRPRANQRARPRRTALPPRATPPVLRGPLPGAIVRAPLRCGRGRSSPRASAGRRSAAADAAPAGPLLGPHDGGRIQSGGATQPPART